MGLKESRVLTGVHPWLAARVRWMGNVIEAWGGVQIYLSGLRTEAEQQVLFDRTRRRPVAAPGCSQHQYGYAVDVAWGLLREESPLGAYSPKEIAELMGQLARSLQLQTVQNDSGHFQVFPASEFKPWAVASGFCDPGAIPAPLGNAEFFCGFGATQAAVDARGNVICRDDTSVHAFF